METASTKLWLIKLIFMVFLGWSQIILSCAKKFTFSRRTFYCFRDEWLHLFKADDEEDAKDKEDLPEQIQKFVRSHKILWNIELLNQNIMKGNISCVIFVLNNFILVLVWKDTIFMEGINREQTIKYQWLWPMQTNYKQ